jgi:hypothetical protein
MTNHAKVGDIVEITRIFPYLHGKARGLVKKVNNFPREGNKKLFEVRVPAIYWRSSVNLKTRDKGNLVIVSEEEIRVV